jgi:hypothetical protein
MRVTAFSAVVAIVLIAAATGQAQTFTLKVKEFPSAGKSVVITESGTSRSSFNVSAGGMVVKEEKKVEVEEKQFTQKTIEVGAKRPLKYSNTYTRATKGAEGSPKKLSYEGKTVVFEKKGEKHIVTPAEGEIDKKDLEDFTKSVNKPLLSEAFLPKKPVSVGDTWELSKEAVLNALGASADEGIDFAKFKGQGKLVKAYKTGKEQWGTFEFSFSVPLNKLGPLPLEKPIDLHAKITMDTAIDGSSAAHQLKGNVLLKGKSEFTQNNMTFMLDIAIDGEFRSEQTAEK